MQSRKSFPLMVAASILLVAATGFWLASATPASAQCGSQASSCKNCHEVQGQMPVNSDGTAWHTSHAFGDFCYICHAGNNQAKEETEAHTGMVPPLSDIKASCMQCHPDDLQDQAQVYATALGIEIGSSLPPASGEADNGNSANMNLTTASTVPTTTELAVDDPNLVDYNQRYNEIVLGKKSFNWGNAILLCMIGLVAIGGGGFVATREKLVRISFGDTRQPSGEYPGDVVALLPTLAGLKPANRNTLKDVLSNPQRAQKILNLIEAVIAKQDDEVSL